MINTSAKSYLCVSRKFLTATSVSEYHPENAVPGKTTQPAESDIPDTAGSAYHSSPSEDSSG